MFGRTVQLDVVKKSKKQDANGHPVLEKDDYVDIIVASSGRVMEQATRMFLIYMAADTARKIVTQRLSK